MLVLVLNAGSSSQKSCLYCFDGSIRDTPAKPLWKGDIDRLSETEWLLSVNSNGVEKETKIEPSDGALKVLLDTLITGDNKVLNSLDEIDAVGHRVVHGGTNYSEPTLINEDVKSAIADLIPLAPSHNPANLEGIKIIEEILPKVPQVAVFDTAFHSTIPESAKVYPIPYKYYEHGIQRYGFHGISHQYCAQRTAHILQQPLDTLKIVTCHIGNGCSLAAIENGICIDTTMGFSPLEGLMMGTRCGSIDPQIPIYMMQEYGLDIEAINRILNKESGLLGVSGISADLRAILRDISLDYEFSSDANENTHAQLALDVYIHRLRSSLGAMVASLNGLDVLVFTAGVGENSSIVREKTCASLIYLGLQLDATKNNAHPVDENIATEDSLPILVIHTQEDWAIAIAAKKVMS